MNTNTHSTDAQCPVCGDGCLTSHVAKNEVEYGGQTRLLDMHYSVCDGCGSEIAGAAESKQNKRNMTAFKKEVDGLLSGAEIRFFRETYRLKQDICAELFGGGAVAFSRYENDDVVQSSQMDRLLRLCMDNPENLLSLAKHSGSNLADDTVHAIHAVTKQKYLAAIKEFMAALQDSPRDSARANRDVKPANDNVYEVFGNARSGGKRPKFVLSPDMEGMAA